MEDRSELFNQLKGFSQRKLKKVETKVVTASGENLVEKRGAKGLQVLSGDGQAKGGDGSGGEPPRKLDLQVGFIVPGLLLASQDVAHDKSSLDTYGITHILNLDLNIENKFEDDYNYKNITMKDSPDFSLDSVLDDCFDFIDDGRHYGNVLVHCSGTIGLSRSTTICIAYLMDKEKQKYDEALNNVKEARSFVKPNEGFVKQLKAYEVKLRGAQQVKDSGIDDPFALRKKQEIEQEKAMVAGAASVKNRMKMFGATLDANNSNSSNSSGPTNRSKSVSPSPFKQPQPQSPKPSTQATPPPSKWSSQNNQNQNNNSQSISKSMTPEPRKSWQQSDSQPASRPSVSGPPPPPPPPPAGSLLDDKKPSQPKSTPKPPPTTTTSKWQPADKTPTTPSSTTKHEQDTPSRTVFGRVAPPPMNIRGGSAIERQESKSSDSPQRSALKLPLKRQATRDSGDGADSLSVADRSSNRSPSPSAALRAAKQEVASKMASNQDDQQQTSHRGQLNRSSTKKILNLIKTKTKTDLTLKDGDEDDEIEALLGALASESISNIDWDELGLDEDEVKGIIEQGANEEDSDESSSSESEESEEEEEEEDEEVEEDEEEEYEVEESEMETKTRRYIVIN